MVYITVSKATSLILFCTPATWWVALGEVLYQKKGRQGVLQEWTKPWEVWTKTSGWANNVSCPLKAAGRGHWAQQMENNCQETANGINVAFFVP